MIYEQASDNEFKFILEQERNGETTQREFPFHRAD